MGGEQSTGGVLRLEEHDDGVVVLHWDDGENRCNTRSMAAWHAALDDLEGRDGPLALVATGTGKFFSNGLDLDGFVDTPGEAAETLRLLHLLFARLLELPAFTVAALNGHTFAAGALIACCFDHRLMRADRGYFCLPEVDLGLAFTDGMAAVVSAQLPRAAAIDASLSGRRYGGDDARHWGIVHGVRSEHELLPTAIESAAGVSGKDRSVLAVHKRQLFGEAADRCRRSADAPVQGLEAP